MRNLLKTQFARNTSWIILGKIYQLFTNLLVSVISVRYLGPEGYGLINYAASLTSLLAAVSTLGLGDVMVSQLIREPEKQGKILGTAIGMRTVSGLLSAAVICLTVLILDPGETRTFWVTLIYSGGMVLQSLESIRYFYQQRLMSRVTSRITMAVRTAVAVYKILLLVTGRDVCWFAFANVVDHGLFGLLLLLCYRRSQGVDQPLKFDARVAGELLGKSHHFILSGLMVALYAQMDKIMIKQLLNEAQVGFYAAAVTVSNLWPFVLGAVIESARPVILEHFEHDPQLYRRRLAQLYGAVLWISLAAGLVITILAKPIVLLLYGPAYLPSVQALRIVVWGTGFSYLGVARSVWTVPNGRQRYEKYLAAMGAAANMALNLLLIPVWGISGAAAATVLTQFVTNCLCGLVFRPLRENTELILEAFRFRKLLKEK